MLWCKGSKIVLVCNICGNAKIYTRENIGVYSWFETYLKHREQEVVINEVRSSTHTPVTGVPQGSVVGPLMFIMYTTPLYDIIIYLMVCLACCMLMIHNYMYPLNQMRSRIMFIRFFQCSIYSLIWYQWQECILTKFFFLQKTYFIFYVVCEKEIEWTRRLEVKYILPHGLEEDLN